MTAAPIVSVPVAADALADVLARQRDFRVLRRLRTMDRREAHGFSTGVLRGVALDVETTGLDAGSDRIIELAVQSFDVDVDGRIVSTGQPRGWLEDPGVEITAEITRVTRLTSGDLKGRCIPDGEAFAVIDEADFLVAHNAAFDCPFLERRLPEAAGKPWICSLGGIDWAAEGFEGRTLSQLCGQMGWFYEPHRAGIDVTALLHLLDHRLADGSTVLRRLLGRAREPTWLIEAVDAPFESRELLKARGYRWNPDRSAWWREVSDAEREAEMEWATVRVYHALRWPELTRIDWTSRYSRK